jgi:FOG: HEAT repeat
MPLFGSPDVAKLSAKGDVKKLIQALGFKESSVRQAAAAALGQIGDARAVEPLIATLKDPDCTHLGDTINVRLAAVAALGQIGDTRAVEPLIATLQDWGMVVQQTAAARLFGDPRVANPLIATLEDAWRGVRQAAAAALGQIGDARAVEPLIATLQDTDWIRVGATINVRQAAAAALGQIGDARAVEPLIAALKDEETSVRQSATEALGRLGWQPDMTEVEASPHAAAHARAASSPAVAAPASRAPETGAEGKTPAVARYESVAPEKTKRAVALVEEYVNKDHPLDATMQMLGVKPTRPIYNVVQNQVQRGSHPHIDMKIVSVASCLPGKDVSDTTVVARMAFDAIEHYASLPKVQALFLLPYRLGAKTVVEGSAVPPEETCRVYSGVENLLLEIYDELPNGGTITDKVVEQKIDELIKSVQ